MQTTPQWLMVSHIKILSNNICCCCCRCRYCIKSRFHFTDIFFSAFTFFFFHLFCLATSSWWSSQFGPVQMELFSPLHISTGGSRWEVTTENRHSIQIPLFLIPKTKLWIQLTCWFLSITEMLIFLHFLIWCMFIYLFIKILFWRKISAIYGFTNSLRATKRRRKKWKKDLLLNHFFLPFFRFPQSRQFKRRSNKKIWIITENNLILLLWLLHSWNWAYFFITMDKKVIKLWKKQEKIKWKKNIENNHE